ncbi:DUF1987 domain-containing protein [Limibacter armeniacum]|uniref:DUF1987 domain-containing protein n=1 Tax=Limibacter armeniacum TaxID=466084 RepID=UPI002FE52549
MKNFYLSQGHKTPKIELNYEKGHLYIAGRSIPENSIEFYRPLIDWVNEYIDQPQDQTVVDIKLEYFNTSSSKCLIEVFRALEELNAKDGSEVVVNWYFEEDDEDMEESGEDFKEVIKVPSQ